MYQRGELMFGPGDPSASIMIDEQSVVFTMVCAKNLGVWPRPKPGEPVPDKDKDKKTGDPGAVPSGGSGAGAGTEPVGGHPVGGVPGSISAEGVLKEALVQLWEQARAKDVENIGILTIRMFEAGDAFRLLGAVGAVSGAEKTVTITDGYETREGGSFALEFRGPVPDAQPVKEFLEPQLRDATSKNLQAGFELTFAEGLSVVSDSWWKLVFGVAPDHDGCSIRRRGQSAS